jgi:hypothetical protein
MDSLLSKLSLGLAFAALATAPLAATVRPAQTESAPAARPETIAQAGKPLGEGPAPALAGEGEAARASAAAFLDWAAASGKGRREEVRQALARARNNPAIASAFCQQAQAMADRDLPQALMALALLGEMRSTQSMPCLKGFLDRPLPSRGTVVDGEIQERKALEILQVKAIEGVAFLRTPEADALVLKMVSGHPSRVVRAEAIAAYLWNHGSSDQAREKLRKQVRAGEEVFIDRPLRSAEQNPEEYDRQLDSYLKAHPELQPPPPVRQAPDKPE